VSYKLFGGGAGVPNKKKTLGKSHRLREKKRLQHKSRRLQRGLPLNYVANWLNISARLLL